MVSSKLLGSAEIEGLNIEELRTAFALQGAILDAAINAIIAVDEKGFLFIRL